MCKKLVIFYRRVSSSRQIGDDKDGLDRQQRAFDAWWQHLPDRDDYDLEEFADEGVSAYSGANITGGNLGKINERVFSGEVPRGSILVVQDMSRFSRRDRRETIIDVWRYGLAGVQIYSLMESRFINSDDIGSDIMTLLQAGGNNDYSAKLSKFVGAAKKKAQERVRLERKGILKGSIPFWLEEKAEAATFNPDTTPQADYFNVIPERAAVVVRVFEARLKRMSMSGIATELNNEGIQLITQRDYKKKSQPQGFTPSAIKNLLRNVAVIGTLAESARKGAVYPAVPDYYPAVIDHALYEAVQLTLTKGKQVTIEDGDESNPYAIRIFKGLLVCSFCGHRLDVNGARGPRSDRGTPFAGSLICRNARLESCMHGPLDDAGKRTRTPTLPMRIVEQALTVGLFEQLNQTNLRNDVTRKIAKKRLELDTLSKQIEQNTDELMKVTVSVVRDAIMKKLTWAGEHFEELQKEVTGLERKQKLQSVANLGSLDLLTRDGRIAAYHTIVKTIKRISINTVDLKADITLLNGNVITGFSLLAHPVYPEEAETFAKNKMSQLADDEFGLLTGIKGQTSVNFDD